MSVLPDRFNSTSAPTFAPLPAAERFPRVQGYCPSCRMSSLFLAAGGYVTCSRIECANPCSPSEALGVPAEAPADINESGVQG